MHRTRIAKAHFGLGRMHVDIDRARIDFQVQHIAGLTIAMHQIAIALSHGMTEQLVAHEAAIDKKELPVTSALG